MPYIGDASWILLNLTPASGPGFDKGFEWQLRKTVRAKGRGWRTMEGRKEIQEAQTAINLSDPVVSPQRDSMQKFKESVLRLKGIVQHFEKYTWKYDVV